MLKRVFDNQSDIPAGFESLYTEKDGKFVRNDSMIEMPPADKSATTALEKTLKTVRGELKTAQDKLAVLGDTDPKTAMDAIAQVDELKLQLETAGKDQKPDENKIADLVKQRVALATAPLDKKITELTTQRDAAVKETGDLKSARKRDNLQRAITDEAVKAGVDKMAVGTVFALIGGDFDVDESGNPITVEREGSAVIPGQDIKTVINDMKQSHPYLWPVSQGGGAQGGDNKNAGLAGGPNPWKDGAWNLTEQGRILARDPKKAAALASAAGVDVNAIEPKKATT